MFRRAAPAQIGARAKRFSLFAAALGARPRPEQGLIIAQGFLPSGSAAIPKRAADPETDLLRRIGRRRIALLSTGAFQRRAGQILDLVKYLADACCMTVRDREQRIAAVRRFNRFYTRQLGVLRKTYLDSPYSLGEARVLYEIASGDAPTASEIGRALDLDAGYLSRTLRNFEKRGLIARKASASDARQSHLALSPRGRKAFAPLERRSQQRYRGDCSTGCPGRPGRLIAAMSTIETLLGGAAKHDAAPERRLHPARGRGRAISAGSSNATPSFTREEYGWIAPFEGVCAQIVADFVNTIRSPSASAAGSPRWTARMSARSCWRRTTSSVARIRLLLVDPKARGLGLGARLTDECIRFARRAGYKKITLWTHSVLTAARHIYQKAGFKLTRTERHRSWGQPVVSEHWDLDVVSCRRRKCPRGR